MVVLDASAVIGTPRGSRSATQGKADMKQSRQMMTDKCDRKELVQQEVVLVGAKDGQRGGGARPLVTSRPPESLICLSYASGGMVIGLRSNSQPRPVPCMVWVVGAPTWAWVAPTLGLKVVDVLMEDPRWTKAARDEWFPDANVHLTEGPLWRRGTHRCWPPVVLTDRVPPASHKLWSTLGIEVVLCAGRHPSGRRKAWHNPDGWMGRSASSSHARLGGRTDGWWQMTWFTRRGIITSKPTYPDRVPSPVVTIMDPVVSGPPCRAPDPYLYDTPQVVVAHENHKLSCGRLYHSEGLFPVKVLNPRFIAPCVYGSTRFCRRPLLGRERAMVWDTPISVVDSLRERDLLELSTAAWAHTAPCKWLSGVGGAVLQGLTLTPAACATALNEGGIEGTSSFASPGLPGASFFASEGASDVAQTLLPGRGSKRCLDLNTTPRKRVRFSFPELDPVPLDAKEVDSNLDQCDEPGKSKLKGRVEASDTAEIKSTVTGKSSTLPLLETGDEPALDDNATGYSSEMGSLETASLPSLLTRTCSTMDDDATGFSSEMGSLETSTLPSLLTRTGSTMDDDATGISTEMELSETYGSSTLPSLQTRVEVSTMDDDSTLQDNCLDDQPCVDSWTPPLPS